MEKEAVIFLDYNETFDDIADGKGNVFIGALKRFVRHFDGNVKIVVITSALCNNSDLTIKDDLAFTLHYFPATLKEKFSYIVEENCKYITKINTEEYRPTYQTRKVLSLNPGTKKDGVERALKTIDPKNKISTCVFAGNSEILDLDMMEANVGKRQKYFLLANRRLLKSEKYPVYRLSMEMAGSQFDYYSDVKSNIGATENLIIKTTNNSYGVGKALEVVTCLLEGKEKDL